MNKKGARSRLAQALLALILIWSGAAQAKENAVRQSFPIVELRQYTLHDGQRDALIDLFEREFIESQEVLGMKVIGTFADLDRPNRFVWLRGFKDMDSRLAGLSSFYYGPVWKAHREAANATMIDSDNVLLLRAPSDAAEFDVGGARPAPGENATSGLVVATIYYLNASPAEVSPIFERQVVPRLKQSGIPLIAWFTPATEANNFPALPVREGEKVLVAFTQFNDELDHSARGAALAEAASPLKKWLVREPEVLRLKPTRRSLIRGTGRAEHAASPNAPAPEAASDGAGDFDFLHGRWNVHHRILKGRGVGSSDWVEYEGTADTRPLLDGLCNVEEHRISGRSSGVALRCYDRSAKRWSIYWVSDRDGLLGAPVHGQFRSGIGTFEGTDTDGGRPIIARFLWHKITPASARWEQSFSYDSGKTWEINWTMDFTRQGS